MKGDIVQALEADVVAEPWKQVHLNCGRCTKRCPQLLVVLFKTLS